MVTSLMCKLELCLEIREMQKFMQIFLSLNVLIIDKAEGI